MRRLKLWNIAGDTNPNARDTIDIHVMVRHNTNHAPHKAFILSRFHKSITAFVALALLLLSIATAFVMSGEQRRKTVVATTATSRF